MSDLKEYLLGFTAASLRPELVRGVGELFLETGDWARTKEAVLRDNLLQCASVTTLSRLEREFRGRLQTLTPAQLKLLTQGQQEARICMAWLACVKKYPFLFNAASRMLQEKIDRHEYTLYPSDYNEFVSSEGDLHPELKRVSESSRGKIQRVVLCMFREMGLLLPGEGFGTIEVPYLPPEVVEVIEKDDPKWLAAFLKPVGAAQEAGLHA